MYIVFIQFIQNIEAQLKGPDVQEQEMEYYAPTKPASEWQIDTVYALRILFHPVTALDDVFPVDLEPSNKRIMMNRKIDI